MFNSSEKRTEAVKAKRIAEAQKKEKKRKNISEVPDFNRGSMSEMTKIFYVKKDITEKQ